MFVQPIEVPMRVALYCRVSTAHQSSDNQLQELERVASTRGWNVVRTFRDDGISGAKGREERPALDALLKAASRREIDLIAVWSIDRLGRSLQNLVTVVNDLQALGVGLFIYQQQLDTTTPSGRLCFSMFGAFAEFERNLIRDRVRVGLERAKKNGVKLGRPTNLNDSVRAAIVALRAQDHSIRHIARQLRVGTGTVYQVLRAA
jgi:DNA invertase Pin-like site-specific DNA recombinase